MSITPSIPWISVLFFSLLLENGHGNQGAPGYIYFWPLGITETPSRLWPGHSPYSFSVSNIAKGKRAGEKIHGWFLYVLVPICVMNTSSRCPTHPSLSKADFSCCHYWRDLWWRPEQLVSSFWSSICDEYHLSVKCVLFSNGAWLPVNSFLPNCISPSADHTPKPHEDYQRNQPGMLLWRSACILLSARLTNSA